MATGGVPSTSRRPTGACCWRAPPGPIRPRPANRADRRNRTSRSGPERAGVTVDLDAWARALAGDPRILADLAWPLILRFTRQRVPVTVVGDPPEAWADRARAAGVRVRPSPRQVTSAVG
ncbi:hypothetical protein [Streptacidiphilus sp. P02-A3a]|uniref:hypothetical protein n=1 Tax=Streptacidiphilus sp. P02-A3a TaxID=2704468 RepID=UPI0015FAD872|nr:hypothetical protein [Streptacidiphilus sp. P02-A3a]QMU71575.1 hypothetical protein GXP74_28410 [Streptacidiphilus sp. P02-A3a]